MEHYLLLILGFVLLIGSGHYLVESSSDLAVRYNIPKIIVGLLIVSFGTSAPELLVSITAALKGHPEMAVGNVVGSNIANIALVLGLTAIIFPIIVKSKTILWDWGLMLIATLILFVFSLDDKLQMYEGIIFIAILSIYIYLSIRFKKNTETNNEEKAKTSLLLNFALLIGSMVLMYYGSNLLIDNASIIAHNWGVSEKVISVTIIAFGTSVPELVTSVAAALKKEMEISIGNIIGSNIFNILSILGITSLIHPIAFSQSIVSYDMIWMIGVAALLLIPILIWGKINRSFGFLFISIYFVYIYLQFL